MFLISENKIITKNETTVVLFHNSLYFRSPKRRIMKKNGVIIAALLLIGSGCSQKMTQEERFLQIAERENQKCPVLMNGTTRFDSTRYDAALNRVSYYYTMLGEADNAKKMQKN